MKIEVKYLTSTILLAASGLVFIIEKTAAQTKPSYVYEVDTVHRHYTQEPPKYDLFIPFNRKRKLTYDEIRSEKQLKEVNDRRAELVNEEIERFRNQRKKLLNTVSESDPSK